MTKILFQKVNIVDADSPFNGQQTDVLVTDGQIEKVGNGISAPDAKLMEGGSLSPGWVDMRVRLTDPGYEWKDDLNSLAQAAVAGGFTRLICLPNTTPALDGRDFIQSLVSRSATSPVYFHPYGALTKGATGEDMADLYDMHKSGAVGFTNGLNSIQKSGTMMRSLQYLHSFDGLMVNYSNDESIGRSGIVNEGPTSTRLGLKGAPTIAEEVMLSRDLKLLEYFEHKLHVAPVTTAGSVELLKAAKQKFTDLSAETSAMYLYLTDEVLEDFDPNYKVFPPLRGVADREALRNAVKEGVIDVISSFHWPEGVEEKMMEFPSAEFGMNGIQTCFSLAYEAMVKSGTIDLTQLISTLSIRPRQILKLPAATIREGITAELTWFDETDSWTPEPTGWRSKSKNTPFFGQPLSGVVKGILAKGELTIC